MDHDDAVRTHAAERYLLAEMSEAERFEFEAHYFDCPPCAADVRLGAALADAARTPGHPATVLPFSAPLASAQHAATGRARPALTGWLSVAAAGVLAIVAGYQALVVIPGLREGAGPVALSPVVLRPVSRGDLPVVTRPSNTSYVTLAMDINVDPLPANVRFALVGASGATVAAGEVPAPVPGSPLLLLMPTRDLTPGSYTLTIQDAANRATEVGAYRFEVR